jgi:hypothetical protein
MQEISAVEELRKSRYSTRGERPAAYLTMVYRPERQRCHPERKRGIFSKVIVARLGYEYFTEDPSLSLGMTNVDFCVVLRVQSALRCVVRASLDGLPATMTFEKVPRWRSG